MRSSGILLHISSLPTSFGIGDLGPSAYRFADLLHRQGQKYWQILPLNWCGYSNSPYNPLSAFATFPYLISPESLYQDGWITQTEMDSARLPQGAVIDHTAVYQAKDSLLAKASERLLKAFDIEEYISRNGQDLKSFLAFILLRELYGNDEWHTWDTMHRSYSVKLFDQLWIEHQPRITYYASLQAMFEQQFDNLHRYLGSLGIRLIGDIPLYCSYNSADVWANQHLFDLDNNGKRITVAGVPPDAFSETGQLWGNPTFRWEMMAQDGFDWWLRRIGNALRFYDLLRLDHFIGYINYWSIPADQDTAVNGKWIPAPAEQFFDTLFDQYDRSRFIAEDLGILNDEVCRIRDRYSLPGMIVLQFCFDNPQVNPALYPADRIIYTGTHDNDTIHGWYKHMLETNALALSNYHQYLSRSGRGDALTDDRQGTFALNSPTDIHWQFIDIAYASPCLLAIVPFQDILALDSTARMNTPGIPLGNWQWRIPDENCLLSTSHKWQDLITKNMRDT